MTILLRQHNVSPQEYTRNPFFKFKSGLNGWDFKEPESILNSSFAILPTFWHRRSAKSAVNVKIEKN